MPVSAAASPSLGTSTSTRPSKRARGRPTAGAGFSTTVTPAPVGAPGGGDERVGSGSSSWSSSTRAPAIAAAAASTSVGAHPAVGPGHDHDRVLARVLHQRVADAGPLGRVVHHDVRGVDALAGEQVEELGGRSSSSPSAADHGRARRRPGRRPPPGCSPCRRGTARSSVPTSVSPARGRRGARMTRSIMKLPSDHDRRRITGARPRGGRRGRRRGGAGGSRPGRSPGPPSARRPARRPPPAVTRGGGRRHEVERIGLGRHADVDGGGGEPCTAASAPPQPGHRHDLDAAGRAPPRRSGPPRRCCPTSRWRAAGRPAPTMPASPWRASAAWTKSAGVPVLARVAASLAPDQARLAEAGHHHAAPHGEQPLERGPDAARSGRPPRLTSRTTWSSAAAPPRGPSPRRVDLARVTGSPGRCARR